MNDARIKRDEEGHYTATYTSFKLRLTPEEAEADFGEYLFESKYLISSYSRHVMIKLHE